MAEQTQNSVEQQSFESVVAEAAAKIGYKEAENAPMTEEEEQIPAQTVGNVENTPKAEEVATTTETKVEIKAEPIPVPPQTVPLAVHIRQRQKFEGEQAEMRRQLEIGNQRLAQIAAQISPPKPPIDPVIDPLGAALAQIHTLSGEVRQINEQTAHQQQQERVKEDVRLFQQAVYQDEQAYSMQVPDLGEAITYAKDMKFREYVALGLDAQNAALRVQQDAFAMAQHAFQSGLSPSELAYRLAGALGYKRANPVVRDENMASDDVKTPVLTQAEQTIEMRAAGAQRAKTGGGAQSNAGPISMQQLANLDNDEFAKMTSGKKWEKLFR